MISLHRAEEVAAEIHIRMQACTIAQGAETDLGVQVFQGRRAVNDDMIPCSTLIEADDVPQQSRVGVEYELEQRYVLFAYVPCDPSHPNVAAHAAIRDLKRALFRTEGRPDCRFGGKVKSVEYKGRDIGPRADGAAYVVAAVEIVVTYVEQVSNP